MKKHILNDLSLTKKFAIVFVALICIGFVVCIYTTIGLQDEKARSGTINTAGLQRALSQNMAKNVLIYMNYEGEKRAEAKKQLETLSERYEKALSDLKNGNKEENIEVIPKESEEVVARLEAEWTTFKTKIDALLSGDMSAGEYIVTHNMTLFNLADENTKTIEQTSTSNIFSIIMFAFIAGLCMIVLCLLAYVATRIKIEKPILGVVRVPDFDGVLIPGRACPAAAVLLIQRAHQALRRRKELAVRQYVRAVLYPADVTIAYSFYNRIAEAELRAHEGQRDIHLTVAPYRGGVVVIVVPVVGLPGVELKENLL